MPRFYCPTPLQVGLSLDLPASATRHVQVLRMQPQMTLTVFNGVGGEYEAVIEQMGRSTVTIQVTSHNPIEREAAQSIHLALGVPANERMDWLVEKATELGVASIQALMTERGVLRLSGERAEKKQTHWQAIASSACEQSGRNRVPVIHPVKTLNEWLTGLTIKPDETRLILSLQEKSLPILPSFNGASATILSGAEGGLSPAEELRAIKSGFQPLSLGNRVLRAETAAIAALASIVIKTS